MKLIDRVEAFLEQAVDGFFLKRFAQEVQPAEIARRLAKDMREKRAIGVSSTFLPNTYTFYVGKADFDRLSSYGEAVNKEISDYLKKEAVRNGCQMPWTPTVRMILDPALPKGKFRTEAEYVPASAANQTSGEAEVPDVPEDTQVFSRRTASGIPAKTESVTGVITVVKGLDLGRQLIVTASRVNIGRRESNELPLADMNTSRLHAYIVLEDGEHVIYDAKSLNGTYVNGHRVTRKRLQSGDRIRLGNTVLLYEAKQ